MPSLAIGAIAFGAGELVFQTKEKQETVKTINEILKEGRQKNIEITKMIPKIDDENLRVQIKEITETVDKIIETVETKPKKYDKSQKGSAESEVKREKSLKKTFFYGRKGIYWGYKVAISKGWQS